ncbi:MAG TPA: tetratricopeptide repeat protein [Longimicrobiales bacterium]|nr:tetratricopeptide repeat protein [Longimicrobiales bacterium]
MRTVLVATCLAIGAAVAAQPACARQDAGSVARANASAEELYRAGRYDEAINVLRATDDVASRRLLGRVLMEVGRYDEAEEVLLAGGAPAAVPAALANTAGELLYTTGRRAEAEALFARAAAGGAADALTARLNGAVAQWRRGARDSAHATFDSFIDAYNDGRARSADDLTAVASAVRYLGATDPALFHDAVRAYEEAAGADPRHAASRLLEGELFLEKYNSTEASALFREVLAVNPRHPRALLGLAKARAFDGTDEALVFVDSSLTVNPNAPDARAFRARQLLGLEQLDSARAEARIALDVDPAHVDAHAVLAAAALVSGDRRGYDDARARALAAEPVNSAFHLAVAEMLGQQRRYGEALRIAQEGAATDSLGWGVRAFAGLTQLRLGDVAAARSSLEASFAGDPYNVWVKNTLDLLDTYPRYVSEATDRFELFLHGDEAGVLSLYMAELAEEAYDDLTRRYGAQPELPIRVEVYPRHADFSVRTVGLAGLGALGVAFGNILAMDSPSAREPGAFNWGSTLWHEIAHAVTLAASDHRVPRWLTEGISVLEERRARVGWGLDVTVDFVVALKQGAILPVSQLNAGFVRPTYPQQVMHAYYQASLVAEFIEAQHGDGALRRMLQAYRAGRSNDEVFRQVLRTEPDAFDDGFDTWIRQRFATHLAAIDAGGPAGTAAAGGAAMAGGSAMAGGRGVGGPFIDAIRSARQHLENGQPDQALAEAERAQQLFPEYTGADSPYRLMHRIHSGRGDARRAAAALRELVDRDETDYAAHVALADALEELDDPAGAADILERAMFIDPFDPQVHVRLAGLYSATGQHAKAVRERRAVLALDPVNRADALYRLALALTDAGDMTEARRQVLRALEIAPNFADAQDLLLRLRGGGA